jgi:DNA processing protein
MRLQDAPLAVAVAISTVLSETDARTSLLRATPDWPYKFWDSLSVSEQDEASRTAETLMTRGWQAFGIGDPLYPTGLRSMKSPPAILFAQGHASILADPAIGMCGSRHASEAGLRAARTCATAAAVEGFAVVSGNAAGVDTEAHQGALDAGGATILVLPEGALHYSARRNGSIDGEHVLVVSQFAPRRPWHVGNAMARNVVIAALSMALVVIEAGSEGGTLDAGKQALRLGRPVIALEFESMPTPPGNAILHERGALRMRRPSELTELLETIRERGGQTAQIGFAL